MGIRERQRELRDRYLAHPERARLTLAVRSAPSDVGDPLHCAVSSDALGSARWTAGAHPAVGGVGDAPCSGDMLLGALAVCQEITLRMVAANHGLQLTGIDVVVEGDWDPRGTLGMGSEFPVGLTAVRCRSSVRLAEEVSEERAARLLRSAERYCVILATLREPPLIESRFEIR